MNDSDKSDFKQCIYSILGTSDTHIHDAVAGRQGSPCDAEADQHLHECTA